MAGFASFRTDARWMVASFPLHGSAAEQACEKQASGPLRSSVHEKLDGQNEQRPV